MPTSGVTAWSMTALQICTAAAQEIGVLGAGEALSANEISDCLVRLNSLLKTWSTKGNLFREATGTVTIPADEASGTLPAGIRDISQARLVVSATYERPLQAWNRAQYFQIPNRAASGDPTAYYFSKGVGVPTLYVWPVPTEETTVKIDYARTAETVTAGSETIDIPQEWNEAVIKNLAVRISNMFGATRADPAAIQKVMAEARELETQFYDHDRPDSYVFEPYGGHYG